MLTFMNTIKTIVRLEAEQRIAELEILTSQGEMVKCDAVSALRRLGFLVLESSDYATVRHQITRVVFRETQAQRLEHGRIAEVLAELRREPSRLRSCAAELAA